MSTTLSKGYIIPAVGDRMPSWCDNLEDNWTRVNSHDHDGTNSENIQAKNITKATASIASGDWAATSGQAGTYEQTVSLPSGYLMASVDIRFLDSNGHPLLLSIEKASTTSYKVYINDNTKALTAVYG
jgi:hypothetical protein